MSIYSNAKWQGMNLRLSNLFNIKFVDYQAPKGFDIKLISSSSDYMPFMPENFNFRGRTHTEETKKKMSATQKAKRAAGIPAPQSSEEFRKAASIRQRGKSLGSKRSKEQKATMKKARALRGPFSDETKKKMSEVQTLRRANERNIYLFLNHLRSK